MTPERIALILAVYGAFLSTVNSIIQFLSRDRVDVILKVRHNMGAYRTASGQITFTLVTATNRGKRPVTIQGFAIVRLDSRWERFAMDVRPPLPCELTESQTVTAYFDEVQLDMNAIESYQAWDSAGRHFYRHNVSWPRRLLSRYRRRFSPKQ